MHAIKVHCCASIEQARDWNQRRATEGEDSVDRYPDQMQVSHTFCCPSNALMQKFRFDELTMRFEEPVAFNRWDSPLFTVQPDDPSLTDSPLGEQISAALQQKAQTVRPNMATVPVSLISFHRLFHSLNS